MNNEHCAERIQRTGDTPAAYLGDSLLMMSVEKGQYFSLNGVGTRVWELLERPTTQAALVQQLIEEYEVTAEVCAAQVAAFLAGLRLRDLLGDVA
jgi:hypothetical protein